MKYETGTAVEIDGIEAEVLEYKRGWYTVRTVDGDEIKAREAELEIPGEDDERTMNTQLKKAKQKYVAAKNANGERTHHCGDSLAELLLALEVGEVLSFADEVLDMEAGWHATRYGHLNPGQRRMNAGNRIRGAIRRGDINPDDVSKVYERMGFGAVGNGGGATSSPQ